MCGLQTDFLKKKKKNLKYYFNAKIITKKPPELHNLQFYIMGMNRLKIWH